MCLTEKSGLAVHRVSAWRVRSTRLLTLLLGLLPAVITLGQFDASQVVDWQTRIIANQNGHDMGVLVLGESVEPRVTLTLKDGSTGVPAPVGFYTFQSLDTNIVNVSPEGRWVAAGYGVVSIATYIGTLPRWRSIKVVPPPPRLTHRYDFEANTNPLAVIDSIGGAHGWLTNQSNGLPALTNGEALFDASGGYIALPPGFLSAHTNLSFALWVSANANTNFRTQSRLFDFAAVDTNGTPARLGGLALDLDYPNLRARWGNMSKDTAVGGAFDSPQQGGNTGMLAGVVAPAPANQFGFLGSYISPSAALPPLAMLNDADNRIGSSLGGGLGFNGHLSELRFFEGALSYYDYKLLRLYGADLLPPPLGELRSFRATFDPPALELASTQRVTVRLWGDFTGATNIDLLAAGLANIQITAPTLLLHSSNQLELPSLGPAYISVYSGNTFLANLDVPVTPPEQIRIVPTAGNAIGVRDNPSPFSVRADFRLVPDLDITSNSLATILLSDTNVLSLWPGSLLAPLMAGQSAITARMLGATGSLVVTVTNPPGFAAAWPRLVHRWEFNGNASTRDATNSISQVTAYGRRLCDGLGSYGSYPSFTGTRAFLDGVGAYFTIYDSPFTGLSNGTIEAWIYCVNPDYEHLFGAYTPSTITSEACRGQPNFPISGYVAFSMGGTAAFRPAALDTNQHYELQAPAPLPNQSLTHLVWVHAPSLGVAELYVNGVLADTKPTRAPLSAGASPYMWLGRNCLSHTTMFYGYIYELRVYDGALAPTQILKNRDHGSTVVSFNRLNLMQPLEPRLTPDRQRLKLAIPNPRSGFILEATPSVGPDALWAPVTTPVLIEQDETVSVEEPIRDNSFYRLRLLPPP